LLFAGGMGLALLSGHADVLMPLVMAGELSYLGLLGTHPKFQKYVDAQEAKAQRQIKSRRNDQILQRILHNLPRQKYDRYERLRHRCAELRGIASDLEHETEGNSPFNFDSEQIAGLDRLLWSHLRLLFTQHSLERFLDNTSVEKMEGHRDKLQEQLENVDKQPGMTPDHKVRRALADNLKTTKERIANYERAETNYQFVNLELDRLENKIKALSEMAINRHDPDFISSQVDLVADSLIDTEKTMTELQHVTGLGSIDEEVPEMMNAPIYIID
jgi:hypothetical protein